MRRASRTNFELEWVVMVVSLWGMMVFVSMGCEFLTTSPAQQNEDPAPVEIDGQRSTPVVRNFKALDKVCEFATSVRVGTASHTDFAQWISTRPISQATDLEPRLSFEVRLYGDSQLQLQLGDPESFSYATELSLRNVSLELIELHCGDDNFGVLGGGCDLWDRHRAGSIGSFEFYTEFIRSVGLPEFWEDYTVELSLLFFGYEYASRLGEAGLRDFDWQLVDLRSTITDLCASIPQEPTPVVEDVEPAIDL